jgi:hypothetical protein
MNISVFSVVGVGVIAVVIAAISLYRSFCNRRAARFGYASREAYFRAIPRNDAEKREALDQALKGLAFCVVGFLFPPLLLVGIFPLFIGARKVAYSAMGLGLIDESDPIDA